MEIKRIDVKEFREIGLLVEANRTFFHPLGLALEVIIDEDGMEKLGGIWDYRDDPEGILYGPPFPAEKIENAKKIIDAKHKERQEILGFIYQTDGEKNGKSSKTDAVD